MTGNDDSSGPYWLGKADGVHWLIGQLLENWSDALSEGERDTFIVPLLAQATGTQCPPSTDDRLGGIALICLMRNHLPAWLRLAGLAEFADTLSETHGYTKIQISPDLARLIGHARDGVEAARAVETLRPGLTPFDHYTSLPFIDQTSDLWTIAGDAAQRAVEASGVAALVLAAMSTTPAGTPSEPFLSLEDICLTAASVAAGRTAWRAFVKEPTTAPIETRDRHAAEALRPVREALQLSTASVVEELIAEARRRLAD